MTSTTRNLERRRGGGAITFEEEAGQPTGEGPEGGADARAVPAAGEPVRPAPQYVQNVAPGAIGAPQAGQVVAVTRSL